MHRPALLPAPAFALRLALGQEMADSLLLASQRVEPAKLRLMGYRFGYDTLPETLARIL
jgi:NAD dependent epimerase/dehydratase family enzyme